MFFLENFGFLTNKNVPRNPEEYTNRIVIFSLFSQTFFNLSSFKFVKIPLFLDRNPARLNQEP